jgi:BON domain
MAAERNPGRDGGDGGGGGVHDLPTGGYQRPGLEGGRAYDPGERGGPRGTGDEFGMPDGSVEQIAEALDEDAILDRVDRDHGARGDRSEDDRVREEVRARLADDPHVDAAAVEVAVSGGEVTLSGEVESRSARRRAEDIAAAVQGVSYVQNDLRARNPFYNDADRAGPVETITGHGAAALPTGAGGDAGTTSETGPTSATTGTGAAEGGDPLLGSEEVRGKRYAKAPVDGL